MKNYYDNYRIIEMETQEYDYRSVSWYVQYKFFGKWFFVKDPSKSIWSWSDIFNFEPLKFSYKVSAEQWIIGTIERKIREKFKTVHTIKEISKVEYEEEVKEGKAIPIEEGKANVKPPPLRYTRGI